MRGLMGALASLRPVTLDARDLLAAKPHDRVAFGIGYMPEDRKLVPDLTVEENIMLPAWTTRLADATERLQWILGFMPEIADMLGRDATTLSGGQQKMAALARALMAGPAPAHSGRAVRGAGAGAGAASRRGAGRI